jgi:hypothetical protein
VSCEFRIVHHASGIFYPFTLWDINLSQFILTTNHKQQATDIPADFHAVNEKKPDTANCEYPGGWQPFSP